MKALVLVSVLIVTGVALGSVSSSDELWNWLDRDRDGLLDPYEGAEAILFLAQEADLDADGALGQDEVLSFLEQQRANDEAERRQAFLEFDADGDGRLVADELPDELRAILALVDEDSDSVVTLEELLAADLDDASAMFEEELQVAKFAIDGPAAVMTGVIGPSTPGRVLELVLEHPEVEVIILHDVPGSMDDEANLRAAYLVRRLGLYTHLPSDGVVSSGGTDFFLAGVRRTADPGARFGVHSWSGLGEEGAEVPKDDPEHAKYLEYYRAMGIPEAFYWYTLEAATADGMHWMTPAEIEIYGVLSDD